MYSIMLLFIGAAVVIVTKSAAASTFIQGSDLPKLLSLIQNQQNRDSSYNSDLNGSDDSEDDDNASSDLDNTRNTESRGDNLLNIITQIVNEKTGSGQDQNDRKIVKEAWSLTDKASRYDNVNNDKSQRHDNIAQILQRLIRKDLLDRDVKPRLNKRITKNHHIPNRLLGDVKDNDGLIDNNSMIYLVLNPDAMHRNNNHNGAIIKLISKLLSLPSSISHRNDREKLKQNYYKGLVLNNIKRRRGSREMYGSNDSAEEKPKRGRGGGGAGHTAIPYIRHRGENIYEKD